MEIKTTQSLGACIADTFKLLKDHIAHSLSKENVQISRTQYLVLKAINEQNLCSQNELAVLFKRNKSSLKRVIDTLEKKGYVQRRTSKTDKRRCEIGITQSGSKVLVLVTPHLQKVASLLESNLSEIEINSTKKVLHKIQETIQNS